MSVVAIGLNHRTAPLGVLERSTLSGQRLTKALHDLTARPNLSEAVVLSTCNRTEIFAVAERFHGGFDDIRNFFRDLTYLEPHDFADHLFVHFDEAAVRHLFEVVSGMESAVLGETEILRQVGEAWDLARTEQTVGPSLNLLFRHALEVGKRVRTETGIGRGITSVSQAAVAMAAAELEGLDDRQILVLGAGEMGEGMALAAAGAGAAEVTIANRTYERAEGVATRVGGRAVRLADFDATLVDADVLLTSTSSTSLVLGCDELDDLMARRGGRRLVVVDIAMPRDVDPAASQLDGVTLLDMDAVRGFVDDSLEGRRREARRARTLVDEEVARYLDASSAREVAPLVAQMRMRAETIRRGELQRLAGRLEGLEPKQREAVEALTKGILAKLLHTPTTRIKDAAGTARGDRLADSVRDLFDLS